MIKCNKTLGLIHYLEASLVSVSSRSCKINTVSSRSRANICNYYFSVSVSYKNFNSPISRSRSRTRISIVLFLGLGLVPKKWSRHSLSCTPHVYRNLEPVDSMYTVVASFYCYRVFIKKTLYTLSSSVCNSRMSSTFK